MITNRGFGFVVFLLGLSGCGDVPLVQVSGTVKYLDQPLPAGQIWFDPDPSIPGAAQGWAEVVQGNFTTSDPKGKGVKAGKYTVRIEGFDGKSGNELPMGKKLFTEYTEVREIAAPTTTLDFDIKKVK